MGKHAENLITAQKPSREAFILKRAKTPRLPARDKKKTRISKERNSPQKAWLLTCIGKGFLGPGRRPTEKIWLEGTCEGPLGPGGGGHAHQVKKNLGKHKKKKKKN